MRTEGIYPLHPKQRKYLERIVQLKKEGRVGLMGHLEIIVGSTLEYNFYRESDREMLNDVLSWFNGEIPKL